MPATEAQATATFRRPVRDLIRRPPVTCPPSTSIAEAARLMQAHGVGSVVVIAQGEEPVGIVTDRDLRGKVVATGLSPAQPVARIMSSPLHTLPPDAPAIEALVSMLRLGIHHLPVVESAPPGHEAGTLPGALGPGRRLVGVVSSN
ncbi:MAG: CBS domain-containing protein, partial [Bacillota bacterium]